MNGKMFIARNMYDELQASGNKLDHEKLSELFGVPMIPTISRSSEGIDKLFHIVIEIYEGSDYVTKSIKKHVRSEVMDELEEWHKDFVSEEHHDKQGVFRHIHVNHGPIIE